MRYTVMVQLLCWRIWYLSRHATPQVHAAPETRVAKERTDTCQTNDVLKNSNNNGACRNSRRQNATILTTDFMSPRLVCFALYPFIIKRSVLNTVLHNTTTRASHGYLPCICCTLRHYERLFLPWVAGRAVFFGLAHQIAVCVT